MNEFPAVLGNHDYRGDAEAQLSPVLRKIDSRWLCLRSFIVNAGKPTPLVLCYCKHEISCNKRDKNTCTK